MDPLVAALVVLPLLAAVAAVVAGRAGRRSAEREYRRREARAEEARERLSREEEALRSRLHDANEALRLRAETLQEILRATAQLKAHLPLDAVLANVVRAASTTFRCRRVLLSLQDRAEGVLVPSAQLGLADLWPELERLRLPAGPSTAGDAAAPSFLASRLAEAGREPLVSIPLAAAGRIVGLLELAGPKRAPLDEAGDRAVLDLFASQAVTAIRLARAYETTRQGSQRDPLTGVANHGRFQEELFRELARHERTGERLVLLLVDLDDFKAVNDRYGHPVGDAVLKSVVARLLESVREMDTVSRYGGEEFTVVLPQTDAADGLRVAERLREAVAAAPIPAGLPDPLPLTVSIGLAVFPEDATSKGALVECADRALYAAKRTGKNRVVAFTRVPRSAEALLTERA